MRSKQGQDRSPNTQPEHEYLTRKEASAYLRISLSKFDQIKDMERIRYGKSVRFSVKALREYAARHTIGGTHNV
jgi:hypothetical protein